MIQVKPGDNIYEVEKIISKRVKRGILQYKVKWERFPLSQATWEPISNLLNVKHLINHYEQKIASKKRRKAFHYSIFQDIHPSILEEEQDNPLNLSYSSVVEEEKEEVISENAKENESPIKSIKSIKSEKKIGMNKTKSCLICPFTLITLPKPNFKPDSIETVVNINNTLYAIVHYFMNDQKKTCLIKTEDFYKNHSEMLIKYYETKINFK